MDKLVLNSRDVVVGVDLAYLDFSCGSFDLAPLVNDELDATGLLEDLSEAIAYGDNRAGLHSIDLVIQCEHVHDTGLIPNNALSLFDLRSIVSFNLLCQFRFLNLRKKESHKYAMQYGTLRSFLNSLLTFKWMLTLVPG